MTKDYFNLDTVSEYDDLEFGSFECEDVSIVDFLFGHFDIHIGQ